MVFRNLRKMNKAAVIPIPKFQFNHSFQMDRLGVHFFSTKVNDNQIQGDFA